MADAPFPKKTKLASDDADEVTALMKIQDTQDSIAKLSEEEAQEIVAISRAYSAKKRPLFKARQTAISAVPSFWLKVLLAHPVSRQFVADFDQDALSYLDQITVEDVDDGFRVSFAFRQNPYFEDRELWKDYRPLADPPPFPAPPEAEASGIKWKDTDEGRALQAMLLGSLKRQARQEAAAAKAGHGGGGGGGSGDGGAGTANGNLESEEKEDGEDLDAMTAAQIESSCSFLSIFTADQGERDYELQLAEALRSEIFDDPLRIFMTHEFEESDGEGGALAEDGDGDGDEDDDRGDES